MELRDALVDRIVSEEKEYNAAKQEIQDLAHVVALLRAEKTPKN